MRKTDELIRRLDKLLDVEREALLQGDLEALTGIAQEKEQLISALSTAEIEEASLLSPIDGKSRRNHLLLEQALSGIRSVSKKLAEIREARQAFDTYDKKGQKNRFESEASPTVEKRA